MISFQQLCLLLTHNGKYSWFEFNPDFLPFLTEEELQSVHVDYVVGKTCRIWYPKEKYEQDCIARKNLSDVVITSKQKRTTKEVDIDKLLKQAMMKSLMKNL